MRLYEFDTKAVADRDFEKVLFGDLKAANEPDTEKENNIFKAVRYFIKNANRINKSEAYDALKYLEQFKDVFPDDIVPKADTVYRGTGINIDQLKPLFKKYKSRNIIPFDHSGYVRMAENFSYRPKSYIQSWTTSFKVAEDFADDSSGFPVIYMTDVDDSFILNSELTNKIAQYMNIHKESELIRITSKPIECVLLMKKSFLDTLAIE